MNILAKRRGLRWLVPVAIAAVAVTAPMLGRTLLADAAPALPAKTAKELLTHLASSDIAGVSGTVVYEADLGIPAIPGSASEFSALTGGSHTLRIWHASPDKTRVALLGQLGESDFVRNGDEIWTWSSETNTATKHQAPAHDQEQQPTDMPKTPEEAADTVLALLGPDTDISTDGTAKVAGRDAYELVLKPKNDMSKIGSVRLAIDADNYAPLRVRVTAADASEPALSIGYTQVSFAVPGDEHFQFSPPEHATIIEPTTPSAPPSKPSYHVVGDSWDRVLVLDKLEQGTFAPLSGTSERHGDNDVDPRELISKLPKASGDWGSGHVFSSRLLSVLLLDNGTTLVGAVQLERLYEVAGTQK